MRTAVLAATLTPLAAGILAAGEISLSVPLDCDLETDCYIQQYVDHDPSEGVSDYRCSNLSYDTHKGTDFALKSLAQMHRGVDVLTVAPGAVRTTRDGMTDQILTADNRADVEGRECGNGIVVEHGDGWTTQYCHLKQGSITVSQGNQVTRRTVLGQVGLSGFTQFPHVHVTLRHGDTVVDPFAPDGDADCVATPQDTLWDADLPYRPGGVLSVGFADHIPAYAQILEGSAAQPELSAAAPALVVFGYAFGGNLGDTIHLTIDGPDGAFMDEKVTLDRDQARFFRAIGKKRKTPAWSAGTYTGTVSLIRDGSVIDMVSADLRIR